MMNESKGIFFDELALKIIKPLLPRSLYRELWNHDLICLIDLKKRIKGLLNNKTENLLVYNFWAELIGELGNLDLIYVTTTGASYTLTSSGDVNYGSAYVVFGSGTKTPSFDQIALEARSIALEGASISPTLISETDKYRLRFGRVSAGSLTEVGLYQELYSGGYTAMLGRALLSVPNSGYNVYYDVITKAPFLKNFAYYLFGILTNTNQTLINRAGGSLTARTSGEVNVGPLYALIGTSNAPFVFDTYDLTNAQILTSAFNIFYGVRSYVLGLLSGAIRLTTDTDIGEVGFAQRVYDTGGAVHDVLLGRIPLSTPISKKAGDVFSCLITFYAS
jgi:hypothetical protein